MYKYVGRGRQEGTKVHEGEGEREKREIHTTMHTQLEYAEGHVTYAGIYCIHHTPTNIFLSLFPSINFVPKALSS